MGRAKDVVVKVIPASIANEFIKKHHYSGKVVNNSCLHFGAFLDGRLHGVMSYGPSLDKSKLINLVEGTGWNEFLELNRMAFDDYLPRNSESRCIAYSLKLIKKNAPHIKWVVSYADGCSCGDGTIYRASNFVLTLIKPNEGLLELPNGEVIHELTIQSMPNKPRPELGGKSLFDLTGGKYSINAYCAFTGAKPKDGFQLRYLYFLDSTCREKLTVPIIPFETIDQMGAGMYKGQQCSRDERHQKRD